MQYFKTVKKKPRSYSIQIQMYTEIQYQKLLNKLLSRINITKITVFEIQRCDKTPANETILSQVNIVY